MSPIRLVTFDVTNTIIKVSGKVGQNYAKIAALYGKNVEPERLNASFGTVYKRYSERYANFGVSCGMTPFKWWTSVVIDTFKESGSDESQLERIAQHLYVMYSTQSGWEVLPNASGTLEKLKQNGLKLGVISNFDDRLEKILTQLALRHYFDFILASAVVKVAKPDVGIFNMALKMADVKPEEALHVGDNMKTDIKGAKSAGFNCVLLLEKDKEVPNSLTEADVIRNLNQLPDFIGQIKS